MSRFEGWVAKERYKKMDTRCVERGGGKKREGERQGEVG